MVPDVPSNLRILDDRKNQSREVVEVGSMSKLRFVTGKIKDYRIFYRYDYRVVSNLAT